ncbi:PPOX class F420-dependent oxidoreductase [Streptomyces sp. NRRL F-5123]|uniref:PPOX class F420-dependent oxidoreductase n=1 Tax=Streptomyces sp. NRRL F-5123 TaxID=1463856 RepID=UPI0004E22852|nr:PPOX class F420-dependent oxidoreductase [Streptomyces sp. NRRL F-5123]
MAQLSDNARALFDAKTYATVATVEPDGTPQLSVVWVTRDGDDVLFSTTGDRRKARNLARNPRVTVLAMPEGNPFAYVEIRGTASVTEDEDRGFVDSVSRKYTGAPYSNDGPDTVRLIVRVTPERVVERI